MDQRNNAWVVLLAILVVVIGGGCPSSSSSNGGAGQGKSLFDLKMEAEAEENPLFRAEKLINVSRLYVKAQDTSTAGTCLYKAEQALEEAVDSELPGDTARCYASLADAWADAGKERDSKDAYKEAEGLLDQIQSEAEKSGVLIDVALVKIKLGDKKKAKADLQSAEQGFDKMLLIERFDLLERFASGFVAMEDSDEAKRVVNDAIEVANAQESPSDRARLLAVAGRVQFVQIKDEQAGRATLDEALTIAESIEDKYQHANAMYYLAEEYFKIGQADTACGILSKAKELVREISEGKPILEQIERLQRTKNC